VTFQSFLASIESPDLRAVAEHWQAARKGRRMPAWRDIDPVALGPRLRHVWAWKYDRHTELFTGRLAGEAIDAIFGKSLRGANMDSFYGPELYAKVYPKHRRVAIEPSFMRGTGFVFISIGRSVIGERIVMPLAEDGLNGDSIFGATVYRALEDVDLERNAGLDFSGETARFFPLDPA
jgi:hypothetical protein